MDINKIGVFIADRRKTKKLTQKDIADKLQVTDRAISKWECGKGLPDISLMIPLCNILEITINELLSGETITVQESQRQSERIIIDLLQERELNKKRVWWQIAIALVGLTVLLGTILLASYHLETGIGHQWIWYITMGVGAIVMVICFIVTIAIALETGSFECKNCKHRFLPTKNEYIKNIQFFGIRRLKCPNCGETTWCKPKLNK